MNLLKRNCYAISTGNMLSANYVIFLGFFFIFSLPCHACNQTVITLSNGEVRNPLYPSFYHGNCTRTIRLSSDLYIRLNVTSINVTCPASLKVLDGSSSNLTIASLCGTSAPSYAMYSTANQVHVAMDTGGSIEGVRFSISYSGLSRHCGPNDLVSPNGNFSSPNWPMPYPGLLNCTWILIPPKGHYSRIKVTSLMLQNDLLSPCAMPLCDHLEIRRGVNSSGALLVKCYNSSCAGMAMNLTVDTPLWFRFYSDKFPVPLGVKQAGFSIEYQYVDAGISPTTPPPEPDQYRGFYKPAQGCARTDTKAVIRTLGTTGSLDCAMWCQRTTECKSVTYVPQAGGSEAGKCTLYREVSPRDEVAHPAAECYDEVI
ncbi:tolloid-like protein 1 isoform X2 [Nematostella vectensis]|nr:tolloid-like protein 1 isoform X2 [Nematostella vectensis]